MVQFLIGWDYSYSPSYSPTIWNPDHLKSELQKVRISNVSKFQMVGFQIPSVYRIIVNVSNGLDKPKVWFSNHPTIVKTEQNGGHLVFEPLENITSKHSVLQCVGYSSPTVFRSPLNILCITRTLIQDIFLLDLILELLDCFFGSAILG